MIRLILTLMLFSAIAFSQSDNSITKKYTRHKILLKSGISIFELKAEKKYGLANSKNEILIPIKYDALIYFDNDLVLAKKNGVQQMFDLRSNQFILKNVDTIKPYFSLNYVVSAKNKVGLYSVSKRKLIVPIEFRKLEAPTCNYHAVLLHKKKNFRIYLFEADTILPQKFKKIDCNHWGNPRFVGSSKKEIFRINFKTGETLFQHSLTDYDTDRFHFIYKHKNLWYFDSLKDQNIFHTKNKIGFDDYHQNEIPHKSFVKKNNLWGLFDPSKQQFIIDAKYDSIAILNKYSTKIYKIFDATRKVGVINIDNDTLIAPKYGEVYLTIDNRSYNSVFWLKRSQHFHPFFNGMLKEPIRYDSILIKDIIKNELVIVKKGRHYGGFNIVSKKEVIPCVYDTIELKIWNHPITKKNGLWGLSHIDGRVILKNQYKFLKTIRYRLILLKDENNKFGIYDVKKHQFIKKMEFDEIRLSDDQIYLLLRKDDTITQLKVNTYLK